MPPAPRERADSQRLTAAQVPAHQGLGEDHLSAPQHAAPARVRGGASAPCRGGGERRARQTQAGPPRLTAPAEGSALTPLVRGQCVNKSQRNRTPRHTRRDLSLKSDAKWERRPQVCDRPRGSQTHSGHSLPRRAGSERAERLQPQSRQHADRPTAHGGLVLRSAAQTMAGRASEHPRWPLTQAATSYPSLGLRQRRPPSGSSPIGAQQEQERA